MFDLFGLPRELRDYIYDELEDADHHLVIKECDHQLTGVVRGLPRIDLLLISRQFGAEYSQRISKRTRFAVEDRLLNTGDYLLPTIPASVSHLARLQFDLFINFEGLETTRKDLENHCTRVNHIRSQMDGLGEMAINLHLGEPRPRMIWHDCLWAIIDAMINVKDLTVWKVLIVDFRGPVNVWDYSETWPSMIDCRAAGCERMFVDRERMFH